MSLKDLEAIQAGAMDLLNEIWRERFPGRPCPFHLTTDAVQAVVTAYLILVENNDEPEETS